jgi:anti-sigma factor RsiW
VTCREFADFIADYLSSELPAPTRDAFDRHLGLCPNCQRYLASYTETVKMGRAAFDDETAAVPATVPEALVRAILEARTKP